MMTAWNTRHVCAVCCVFFRKYARKVQKTVVTFYDERTIPYLISAG